VSGAPSRVLLIYSRVGGGHLSAARAVAEEFADHGVHTRLSDIYLECGRFPVTLFPRAYAQLARKYPRLWSFVYHTSGRGIDATRTLRPFLQSGVRELVDEERPDLVLSVLPAVNGVLAEVHPRVEVVLTDWHAVHRMWVAPGVRHYTAPTETARLDCLGFGAPADSVDVVGIPVRRAFGEHSRVPSERFTILMMVGAEGSPAALATVRALADLQRDARVTVVCGRNQKLRRRVARLGVEAVGFVENVAELMRSADVLITKAGGLTLAEAFCSGVPTVVYDVLPGQEAGNVAYALSRQAIVHATGPDDAVRLVQALFDDARRRAELAEHGRALARPSAARDIVARALGEP
jgi:UDP-N-acetylglucosamine:LPS N-acetylglucosamine transferase